jgi:hypothetical protein
LFLAFGNISANVLPLPPSIGSDRRVSSATRLTAPLSCPLNDRIRTPAESGGRNTMFDNYVIEIRPKAAGITVQAGIVVRDGCGFRFFAATHAFNPLEGHLFKNPREAERAALRHVTGASAQGGAARQAHSH